ncbi:MAG: hypothetical protein E6H09_06305 [Bacteroidetes bacterium]|nr:MAG: hypothetical protein E6H09_06305 [Bacteroidota bacterium]
MLLKIGLLAQVYLEPCTKDWNYTVRLYRPRPDILNGKWKFPEPELVDRLNKKSDYERIDRKY